MLRTFILNADGSVSLSKEEPVVRSKLAKILERLPRGNYTAAELMPLISSEIARAKSNITAGQSSSESQETQKVPAGLVSRAGLREGDLGRG
jgi:hypothetical protein